VIRFYHGAGERSGPLNSNVMRSSFSQWMKQQSRPVRWFLIGVGVDLAIALLLIVLTLVYYLGSYNGTCPDLFNTSNSNCSLPEYLGFYFVIALLVIYVAKWFILIFGLLPPLIGLVFGSVFRNYDRA